MQGFHICAKLQGIARTAINNLSSDEQLTEPTTQVVGFFFPATNQPGNQVVWTNSSHSQGATDSVNRRYRSFENSFSARTVEFLAAVAPCDHCKVFRVAGMNPTAPASPSASLQLNLRVGQIRSCQRK
jgi:hypothetical protein